MSVERGDTIEWETIHDRIKGRKRLHKGTVNKVDGYEITYDGDNVLWQPDVIYLRIVSKRNQQIKKGNRK